MLLLYISTCCLYFDWSCELVKESTTCVKMCSDIYGLFAKSEVKMTRCSPHLVGTNGNKIYFYWLCYFRKKHVKNCQIRDTYGDKDGEESCNEEEALLLTETAITDGTAGPPPMLAPVPLLWRSWPGSWGKKCKWCGSKTHLRKSHEDCPFNKRV